MIYAVALSVAGTLSRGGLDEIEAACRGVGTHCLRGEINQAGVVCRRALGGADTVSVVTDRARRLFIDDVQFVLRE